MGSLHQDADAINGVSAIARLVILRAPGADTVDALDLDVGDIASGRAVGDECCAGSYVGLGEPVQQFGGATFGYVGATGDDEVVVQRAGFASSFYGEHDTVITADILEFAM